jgi:Protein of unknown function DUF262
MLDTDMAESDDNWKVDETEAPGEEEADEIVSYEILNYPADTTLKGYLEQWDVKQLKIPEFQRRYVWDIKKASKLIESFLLGLPVPGVFLFKERDSARFLIIDGQQRITSVVAFQKELFNDKVAFRLQGVSPQWEGKKFSELSDKDHFKFETAVMRATIIQQLKPDDSSSIYHIFERLNTGGVNLNPMEIRQCIGYQPFIKMLQEINHADSWRALLGKKPVDKRLRDVELVLRVMAVNEWLNEYDKPMKSFLNKYVESKRGADDSFPSMKERFEEACKAAVTALGKKPFHLRGRLNYGVLDSVLSTLLKNGPIADLKAKFEALTHDPTYLDNVTKNTSDASVLKSRLQLAAKFLV